MPDRDLIAEARTMLDQQKFPAPAAIVKLRYDALRSVVADLADELAQSRARITALKAANTGLEQERDQLAERVNELAAQRNPDDDVLVEGSWFHPADLPKVLGNYMRACAEEERRSKELLLELKQRPPARVITAVAELDALPDGAIIRSFWGVVGQKEEEAWVFPNMIGHEPGTDFDLPATVLWEPEEGDR